MLQLGMEIEAKTISGIWTNLTGRERVLMFHLGNVPMAHLAWDDLDDRQRGMILNAGNIVGLDHSRLQIPDRFSGLTTQNSKFPLPARVIEVLSAVDLYHRSGMTLTMQPPHCRRS